MRKKKEERLIKAKQLLADLFPPEARPSERWLRKMRKNGTIPTKKVGGLVFFEMSKVRAALDLEMPEPEAAAKVEPKGNVVESPVIVSKSGSVKTLRKPFVSEQWIK